MSKAAEEESPRGGKRERTRAALIQATLDVVAEKGFAAANLDEIAARAYMTKGAIYSNFSGRAELLLVAAAAKGLAILPVEPKATTLRQALQEMTDGFAKLVRSAGDETNFAAEFLFYALSDPELRKGIATFYSYNFARIADYLSGLEGARPGISAQRLAVAIQSIALGFVCQSFLTPEEVTAQVIGEVMNALADGVASDDGLRAAG